MFSKLVDDTANGKTNVRYSGDILTMVDSMPTAQVVLAAYII